MTTSATPHPHHSAEANIAGPVTDHVISTFGNRLNHPQNATFGRLARLAK